MGDFLQQLAERSLGVAPAVRPRPASRFEPPPVEELEVPPGLEPSVPAQRVDGPVSEPVAGSETSGQSPPAQAAGGSRDSADAAATPPPARPARPPAPREAARPETNVREASSARDRPVGRQPGDVVRPEREPEQPAVRTQLRRRAARPTSAPETHVSEPPAVQVTIDRIEVRAVAPPPPRPGANPRRPAPLSLDEYLEQRRSGRR
jgi:hypothetical protein